MTVIDRRREEPDFPTPTNISTARSTRMDQNFTEYTNSGGIEELEQAICDRHASDYAAAYTTKECIPRWAANTPSSI